MDMTPLPWSKLGGHFTDEDKAREYMEFLRWGNNGPACPHCGGTEPYRLTPKDGSKTRKGLLKCRACRKQFTVTVGTVFEDSHIKLTKWLQAIYLIGASKKGISAHQLHRMLGVTYRSAWFMAHRLRYAMNIEPLAKLAGTVEIDEGYIGGKRKNGRGRKPADGGRKAAVAVLVERGGRVKALPMDQDQRRLHDRAGPQERRTGDAPDDGRNEHLSRHPCEGPSADCRNGTADREPHAGRVRARGARPVSRPCMAAEHGVWWRAGASNPSLRRVQSPAAGPTAPRHPAAPVGAGVMVGGGLFGLTRSCSLTRPIPVY